MDDIEALGLLARLAMVTADAIELNALDQIIKAAELHDEIRESLGLDAEARVEFDYDETKRLCTVWHELLNTMGWQGNDTLDYAIMSKLRALHEGNEDEDDE